MSSSIDPARGGYDRWLAALLRLARAQDVEWLIAPGSDTHRAAFDQGMSPEEELAALKDMSEWRGCGCGGG
ncbi:MAG TPA: hypothetical protein VJS42_12165 [Steroidobacteraceae bacterium]|nr:hypothetical protein [Steroidobacteraceae bacterium]